MAGGNPYADNTLTSLFSQGQDLGHNMRQYEDLNAHYGAFAANNPQLYEQFQGEEQQRHLQAFQLMTGSLAQGNAALEQQYEQHNPRPAADASPDAQAAWMAQREQALQGPRGDLYDQYQQTLNGMGVHQEHNDALRAQFVQNPEIASHLYNVTQMMAPGVARTIIQGQNQANVANIRGQYGVETTGMRDTTSEANTAAKTDTQRGIAKENLPVAQARANAQAESVGSHIANSPNGAGTTNVPFPNAPAPVPAANQQPAGTTAFDAAPQGSRQRQGYVQQAQQIANTDIALRAADDISNRLLSNISPYTVGAIGNRHLDDILSGSERENVRQEIATMRGQVFNTVISSMRQGAQGSTGMGRILQSEVPLLQGRFGSLENSQTPAELERNLRLVTQSLHALQDNARQGFQQQSGVSVEHAMGRDQQTRGSTRSSPAQGSDDVDAILRRYGH